MAMQNSERVEFHPILPSLDKLVVATKAPEIAKIWEQKGITNFDFFRLSAHQFDRNGNYPGWNVKPEAWFWDSIREEKISSDAAKLEEMVVAIDRTQKPIYNGDKHLYENDPFADLLKKLRKEKKIKVPRKYRHIPDTSRSGISPDELDGHVLPEIAKMLGVDSSQVRLPKEIEFNVIGNLSHREWGNTNTWEWMQDKFEDDLRLVGGDSDDGGLASVYRYWHDARGSGIGFRPLVVFPSKT